MFLGCFEPMVAHFGLPTIPKCLENGLFGVPKWVNNGSKMCFSKHDHGPLGVPPKLNAGHLEPTVSHFGPSTVGKRRENGQFCDQRWVGNGIKVCFPESNLGPYGLHKQGK